MSAIPPKADIGALLAHVRFGPTADIASTTSRYPMPPARQPHRELSEVADFAVDRDGATVLLGHDLVADR